MSAIFSFHNLIAYSVQISLLVIVGTLVPWMLRLKTPKIMYIYWRSLLGVCLLLPFIQPLKSVRTSPLAAADQPSMGVQEVLRVDRVIPAVGEPPLPDRKTILSSLRSGWGSRLQLFWRISGWVLMAGIVVRLLALLLGYWRLGRYRRTGRRLFPLSKPVVEALDHVGVSPEIYISEEIDSPVTFGLYRASVLLPVAFLEMAESHQRAIVTHELLHVLRRDWLSILFEELVRGLLWFEPAVWWLLSRIQLTREHVVDREVVKHTQAPKDYVQVLLEVAYMKRKWEMTPAPLFLARQQLLQRVTMILQEAALSRKRLVLYLATNLVLLTIVGGLVLRAFPMMTVIRPNAMGIPISEVKKPDESSGSIEGRAITLSEGDKLDGINLSPLKGGGTTGQVIGPNHQTVTNTQTDEPQHTGSISGRVTIGNDPAPGVQVGLYSGVSGASSTRDPLVSATTDNDGRYTFANLPPGSYRVKTTDPLLIMVGDSILDAYGRAVTLRKGDKLEGINLSLVKAGVITGRVTDPDDQPVIKEHISLWKAEDRMRPHLPSGCRMGTDGEGIYRLDGVPPGRYLVGAGGYDPASGQNPLNVIGHRLLTYHPNVTDWTKATIVEVAAGQVVSGIDIVLEPPIRRYSVSGRVVDADSGAPVANMGIAIQASSKDGTSGATSCCAVQSDAAGFYQLPDLVPGRYGIYADSHGKANYSGETTPFEIVDEDLHGVNIRVARGATISGQVVVGETADPTEQARLANVKLFVGVEMMDSDSRDSISILNPDGSFQLEGLPGGTVRFDLLPFSSAPNEFAILRVERNRIIQSDDFRLSAGEQVTGVRIVLGRGTGSLHGQVKVIGGDLPPGSRLMVGASRKVPAVMGSGWQVQVDSRGQFLFEKLPVGNYEMILYPPFTPDKSFAQRRYNPVRQDVTIREGSQTDVVLVFDLQSEQKAEKP